MYSLLIYNFINVCGIGDHVGKFKSCFRGIAQKYMLLALREHSELYMRASVANERASLYHENPAIVAGFKIGYADGQKKKQKSAQNIFVGKARQIVKPSAILFSLVLVVSIKLNQASRIGYK